MLNKRGFTLIEVVVVITVIGIMAAVLIPTFSVVIDKANRSAAEQEATSLRTGILSEYVGGTFDDYCEEFVGSVDGSKSDIKIADKILNNAGEEVSAFGDYLSAKEVKGDITIKKVKIKDGKIADSDGKDTWVIQYKTSKYSVTITAQEVILTKN